MEALAVLIFFAVFLMTVLLAMLVIALDNLVVPEKPVLPDKTTIRIRPVETDSA